MARAPYPPANPASHSASNTSQPATTRADWLPWFLSVFGAGCAVFVLVKGVLPARTVNQHLMERVSRLETAAQHASSERASLEEAKSQLLEQARSAPALAPESSAPQESESERQARELARKDMSQTFAEQIAAGDLWFEQRQEQLAIGIRPALLFRGDRTEVTWKGRRFLRAFAENLKHLPSDQRFEIAGHFDPDARESADRTRSQHARAPSGWDISARRAASVARYLEEDGGIAGAQLMAAGFSRHQPEGGEHTDGNRIEVVLLPDTSKMRSAL